MNKLASIIVPAYNLDNFTIACLDAIQHNTAYRPIEILWVDNGSEPKSYQRVQDYLNGWDNIPLAAIRLEKNKGWVGGCWAGFKETTGSYVVLLNNDTLPARGWLAAMIAALKADPKLGIVGCVTQNDSQWQGIPKLKEKWPELKDAPEEGQADWLRANFARVVKPAHGMVAFFATVLRREMIDEIGFLHPRFQIGLGEDDEYCHRARLKGWDVGVALDSYVYHYHRSTFKQLRNEGASWAEIQRKNAVFLYWKQFVKEEGMGNEPGPVLKYLGKNGFPWVADIPARDLNWDDVTWLEMERGLTIDDILASGLYLDTGPGESKSVYGPEPFCGALKTDGTRCKRPVKEWGAKCYQHPAEEVIEIETEASLSNMEEEA